MRRKPLKYIQTVDGRHYFRKADAPRMRLPNAPFDSEQFLNAYLFALKQSGETPPPSLTQARGTIAALVADFEASAVFAEYSTGYQRMLTLHLAAIVAKGGEARGSDLRAEHIASDLSKLPVTEANRRRKAWAALCAFGKSTGKLRSNPAEGVKLGRKLPTTEGHEPWLPEHVEAFRAKWPLDTPARRAFEVIHWTGARISDAVLLGDAMLGADGVLAYRQEKTGELAYVPWTCPLPGYADRYADDRKTMFEALETRPQRRSTFLATAFGESRSNKAVGNLVAEAARDAGLVDRTAHGLRKTRAIALAEGGASTLQIMAWTGHLTMKEIERYTRKFARRNAVKRA